MAFSFELSGADLDFLKGWFIGFGKYQVQTSSRFRFRAKLDGSTKDPFENVNVYRFIGFRGTFG